MLQVLKWNAIVGIGSVRVYRTWRKWRCNSAQCLTQASGPGKAGAGRSSTEVDAKLSRTHDHRVKDFEGPRKMCVEFSRRVGTLVKRAKASSQKGSNLVVKVATNQLLVDCDT